MNIVSQIFPQTHNRRNGSICSVSKGPDFVEPRCSANIFILWPTTISMKSEYWAKGCEHPRRSLVTKTRRTIQRSARGIFRKGAHLQTETTSQSAHERLGPLGCHFESRRYQLSCADSASRRCLQLNLPPTGLLLACGSVCAV